MADSAVSRHKPGDRGMALLLVVSVIALLSVVIINFSRSMQLAVEDASQVQDEVMLESLAQSGLDIGMAVLQGDLVLSEFDSLLENWALLGEVPIEVGTGESDIRIGIADLDGRFPINSLVEDPGQGQNPGGGEAGGLTPDTAREVLKRLLLSGLFAVEDEAEANMIVDSITDWIDADDDEMDNGAERTFYDSLETPIVPRNGPMEFVEEMLQVNGVTRALLYGNDEKQALAEYVSVALKSRRININTAPVALIMALDDRISDELIDGLDEFRTDGANAELLADSGWFSDFLPADIGGGDLQSLLTVQSSTFIIESAARHRERTMVMRMTIERVSDAEMKILSYQQD